MKGKWAYLKSKLPYASEDVHFTYLNNNFNKYVFTPDELKKSIESAIASYILELRGVENQLLVNIRADIFDSDLYESGALPEFNSDRIFQEDYNKMLETVTKHVSGDLSVDVSRELFSLIAGEIAAKVALRVGTAVSTRLGLTAGIATTGVAYSWATLGVSIAAVIVIDIAVDWLLKLAGYEPEKQVEDKVKDTLSKIQLLLIEGDSQAIAAYEKLRRLESEDPDENVRKACKSAADSIERSGNLGLRRELINVHKWRSDVRKGALKKLIQEGGKSK